MNDKKKQYLEHKANAIIDMWTGIAIDTMKKFTNGLNNKETRRETGLREGK